MCIYVQQIIHILAIDNIFSEKTSTSEDRNVSIEDIESRKLSNGDNQIVKDFDTGGGGKRVSIVSFITDDIGARKRSLIHGQSLELLDSVDQDIDGAVDDQQGSRLESAGREHASRPAAKMSPSAKVWIDYYLRLFS